MNFNDLAKAKDEIARLSRLLAAQQEATARALNRAERAERELSSRMYDDDGQPSEAQEWRDFDPDC